MKKKKALITGINGQDGSYLAELLIGKGYEVHGLIRRASTYNRNRIEGLGVKLHYGDMTDTFSILWALKNSRPDEIYNLAAQSHVQVSWETPWYTAQTTGVGMLNLLESVRVLGIKPRIYQASTSELFDGLNPPQDENTVMNPISPYGTAKMYAFQIAKNYRDAYGMFICNGILFNHESPRRGLNFVTQKIVSEADKGEVYLGNIDAKRDWGYAPEYMEAAWRMLQQDKPDDYVIATGETHTVEDFVHFVEEAAGKKIKIIIDKEYVRPVDVPHLRGNPQKARKKLKWKHKVNSKQLAKIMYEGRKVQNV
jgi:GDPmannose 4,6-dehydratase